MPVSEMKELIHTLRGPSGALWNQRRAVVATLPERAAAFIRKASPSPSGALAERPLLPNKLIDNGSNRMLQSAWPSQVVS